MRFLGSTESLNSGCKHVRLRGACRPWTYVVQFHRLPNFLYGISRARLVRAFLYLQATHMIEQETVSREVVYFIGSGLAAFLMALLRTAKFADREQRHFVQMLVEGGMCAMISGSMVGLIKTYFSASYSWAIPIGVIVGFVGTNFIHVLIKTLIEFQVGRVTGGKVSAEDIERALRERERERELSKESKKLETTDKK